LTTAVTTLEGGSVSTTTSYTSTLESTVLTVPPGETRIQSLMTSANFGVVTTTVIEVWNVELTGTQISTSPTFQVTSSVLPPPFTTTDDPNPESQAGVSPTHVTRIITPPPYPIYSDGARPTLSICHIQTRTAFVTVQNRLCNSLPDILLSPLSHRLRPRWRI